MTGSTATETLNAAAEQLLNRFQAVRAATLAFVEPLSPEDMMVQSCSEASPVKWHLAHTSWFFETFVLSPFANGYKAFHPDFHWLFNSYYNSLGEMPAKNLRSSFSRPALDQILAYREHVDGAVAAMLQKDLGLDEDDVLRRVTLGLEHEQQHLELIATDIKYALFTNPLRPVYHPAATSYSSPSTLQQTFVDFPGGLTQIGITPDPKSVTAFAFDNETPRHTVFLQPFSIADRLITVEDYLAFMQEDGYTRPELWLSEGWAALRQTGWQAPLYWLREGVDPSGWRVYTLRGSESLEAVLRTPVCHLSFFEADAYARWAGCRLPTEFEWEHAAESMALQTRQGKPDADAPTWSATEEGNNSGVNFSTRSYNMLETANLHPTPAPLQSGLRQVFGDVWEWTSSGYTGYPGYHPLPGALGEYNGKFMSSQGILRGGSCVTPATHIRATYRNFFPPATRWQFSGLRLAKDLI